MVTERDAEKAKQLRHATWAFRTQKFLGVAAQVAEDVLRLRSNPSIRDFAAIGIRVVGAVAERVGSDVEQYFDDWYCIDDMAFVPDMMNVITKFPTRKLGGPDSYTIMITDVFGEEVGWIKTNPSTNDTHVGDASSWYLGPWIHFDRHEQVTAALGRALWENMTSKYAVLSTVRSPSGESSSNVTIKPDMQIAEDVFESKRSEELYEQLQKFYTAGVNRSMMLLGPPGTGKTTIMKSIARRFDTFTLRIHIHELNMISINTVTEYIRLLRPEVLIIDDFDRLSGGHTSLLTALEVMNKLVKVLVVSVNDISEIDPAVIRPGRIDTIVEIDRVDDEVIDNLLDRYDVQHEARVMLATWPVAFIHEFAKRVGVLGVDATVRELVELRFRVERINRGSRRGQLPSYDEMVASFAGSKPTCDSDA
jgi:hypothetical protein